MLMHLQLISPEQQISPVRIRLLTNENILRAKEAATTRAPRTQVQEIK
jgi:hypothetical protein